MQKFRWKDTRLLYDRQGKQRGSTIKYTREHLQVQLRDDLVDKYNEALRCEVTSTNDDDLDLLVGVVYRSPLST